MRHEQFGTVRCYDSRVGRGWIEPDDGGSDIAVYQAAIDAAGLGLLVSNQKIGYKIYAGSSGPRAVGLWATWSNR